LSGKI
jgi:hypothetical protein